MKKKRNKKCQYFKKKSDKNALSVEVLIQQILENIFRHTWFFLHLKFKYLFNIIIIQGMKLSLSIQTRLVLKYTFYFINFYGVEKFFRSQSFILKYIRNMFFRNDSLKWFTKCLSILEVKCNIDNGTYNRVEPDQRITRNVSLKWEFCQ